MGKRSAARATKLADTILEDLWFGEDDPACSAEQASASLAAAIAEIQGLKPFPVVAQKVLQLTRNANCRIQEVAHAVNSDPSLASRTLRLANSAAFSRGKSLDSVDEAIVRLGLSKITSMMTAISVMGLFDDTGNQGAYVRDHCVGVGTIAQALAKGKNWRGHGQLFLSGLFHDLGRLLLMQSGDLKHEPPPEVSGCSTIHRFERQHLGYDHAVLGGHVLRIWDLPETLARVVAWHHEPARAYEEGGDVGLMVAFVRVADRLDEQLASGGEWDDDFRATLLKDSGATYAGVSQDDLVRHEQAMLDARREALNAFS